MIVLDIYLMSGSGLLPSLPPSAACDWSAPCLCRSCMQLASLSRCFHHTHYFQSSQFRWQSRKAVMKCEGHISEEEVGVPLQVEDRNISSTHSPVHLYKHY
ncbi:hypothetical protein AMECASPLE_020737 [Ameca splendens]|uniref:Uncharacterized protein n=1 Tax=Ameca splendens TaxID=208324 RepID=A0ABV0ZP78_9TELE